MRPMLVVAGRAATVIAVGCGGDTSAHLALEGVCAPLADIAGQSTHLKALRPQAGSPAAQPYLPDVLGRAELILSFKGIAADIQQGSTSLDDLAADKEPSIQAAYQEYGRRFESIRAELISGLRQGVRLERLRDRAVTQLDDAYRDTLAKIDCAGTSGHDGD